MKRSEVESEGEEAESEELAALLSGLSPKKKLQPATKKGKTQPYSRKSKSLGLLAVRFVDMCREQKGSSVSLDVASKTLAVVRRRIYDVVNVLQSIGIVARQGKNTYSWLGATGMRAALAEIKNGALDDDDKNNKRGESLGALSRKFVELFLRSEEGAVLSLEGAAAGMQRRDSTPDRQSAAKTKVRRLYDVANIFSALGLIEKKKLSGARKPGFAWNHSSPLVCGNQEFFAFDKDKAAEDADGEEEDEEDEEDEEEDGEGEEEVCQVKTRVERVPRVQKRKLFDVDDETMPSPGSMLGLIQSSFKQQKSQEMKEGSGLSLSSLAGKMEEPVKPLVKAETTVLPAAPSFILHERALKFPVVKASTPVKKDAIVTFASPETEKSVASLLLSFSGGSPSLFT